MLPIVLLLVTQSVVFLLVIPGAQNRRVQEFSLYSVTEQLENYTQNVGDLDLVSGSVRENKLQSVCSQMGVWAFFTGKNYTTVNSYGYHPATPGWTCSKRRIMADWQSPFRSIRHLGNVDLDTPSLSLYTDPFFASEELYMNGHELAIGGSTLDFASFGFTGRESWTLYSEANFSGESVCLLCKCDTAGIAIGVTYTAKLTLSAASVRRGCFGTQVLRPTGVLEKRQLSGPEQSSPYRNFVSLSLSNSDDANASLTFIGTEVRLPCKKSFDTFQISKKSNWTVFGGNNFDGPSACLVYSPSTRSGRGGSDSGSDPLSFPTMSILSIRFGCPQNLEKKNAHAANPVPIFVANEKGTNPEATMTVDNSLTPTPPSREGRGREIGPVYIPGDIDGLVPKTSLTSKPQVTDKPRPVTPSPANEPLVSTGSAVSDNNQVGPVTAAPTTATTGRTQIPPRLDDRNRGKTSATYPPNHRDKTTPTTTTTTAPTTTTTTAPTTTTGRTEMSPSHDNIPRLTSPGTSTEPEEVTEPSPIREHHGNDLDARPPSHTHTEAATVGQGGPASMFFTAFLIILGILVTAMIVTIAVFIYLRATRSAEVDLE